MVNPTSNTYIIHSQQEAPPRLAQNVGKDSSPEHNQDENFQGNLLPEGKHHESGGTLP